MKLLCASDLHLFREEENVGRLQAFAEFAKSSDADLILLAGDIVEYPASSPLDSKRFMNLFGFMMQVTSSEIERRKKHKKMELSPFEQFCAMPIIAEEICSKPIYPADMKEMAREYLDFIEEAEWQMRNAYGIASHILKSTGKQVLAVGGNHDLRLEDTILKEMDIHRKSRIINGCKIAGYGGAAGRDGMPLPKGCPPELTTPFNEYPKGSVIEGVFEPVSEPKQFLEQEKPAIALLHTPLYGLMDTPSKYRGQDIPEAHFGSPGMGEYALTGQTALFLSGHVHDGACIARIETQNKKFAVAVNLGCLGKTDVDGGTFAEIELKDNELKSATIYQMLRGGTSPIITMIARFNRNDNTLLSTLDGIYLPNNLIESIPEDKEWRKTKSGILY